MTYTERGFSNACFSIFSYGYWNEKKGKYVMQTKPEMTQGIEWAYRWISSPMAASGATIGYRAMMPTAAPAEKSEFKLKNFKYATFAGTFEYRNAEGLIQRSPFMVLDIDGLASLDEACELRQRLSRDAKVETALCFVSPSGRGVKWVFELPQWTMNQAYKRQFDMMRDYLGFNYGYNADTTGSDVCRACYLPYDPDCYVNPKYLSN